jgi:hypothetical protein
MKKQDQIPTLEATWWLFDESTVKNLYDLGKEAIKDVMDKFKVKVVVIDSKPKVFEAKYELIKYQGTLKYSDAKLPKMNDELVGWADFLGGCPYGVIELMALLYGESTKPDKYLVEDGKGAAAAPIPADLFGGYDEKQIPYNTLYLEEDWCDAFSDGFGGLESPRWWQRINFPKPDEKQKWPTPGEFVGLGIRMFPDKPWGDQESSPFLSSGNWFDTLYYTGAKVIEVKEPDDTRPFKLYKVRWRAKDKDSKAEFWARSSGFEEYQKDDRVTILKDAATDRKSQTWEDDQEYQKEVWRIVPITFWKKDEKK